MNRYCPICACVTSDGRRWANGVCLDHPYMAGVLLDRWIRSNDPLLPYQVRVIEREFGRVDRSRQSHEA